MNSSKNAACRQPFKELNILPIQSQYIAHLQQVSQPKISDFSGQTFKGFEVLYFSMSATMTQLLSSC